MIPKIINQTAPADKTKWHPLWHRCQQSWQEHFSDFEYRLWTDDDIDNLIRDHYPQYWKMYQQFPVHIMKIDFVRFAIMHHTGGVYADMDYYCYQNFYDELTSPVYLVENPYGNDPIENSLMCSKPGHDFWIHCMDMTQQRFDYVKSHKPDLLENMKVISADRNYGLKLRPYLVFYIAGTNLIASAYRSKMNDPDVDTLSALYYNNCDISYDPSYRARHIHTGLWGEENQQLTELLEKEYKSLRNIPVESYDFYHDYSNGKYLRDSYALDWSKNDCETQLFGLKSAYDYS
jgi:hypothetical protein